MKKILSLASVFLITIGTLFSSCENETKTFTYSSEQSEDNFMKQVKFVKISETSTRSNPTIPPNKKTVGIIRARIARKSKGCNSGFGLCDFKLFPKNSELAILENSLENDHAFLFEVEQGDSLNLYKTNILLASPLPQGFSEVTTSLKIEDAIYWIKDEMSINETKEMSLIDETEFEKECQTGLFSSNYCCINPTIVKYDPTLGEHGGYQIKIQGYE